jgi:hypothetical protein
MGSIAVGRRRFEHLVVELSVAVAQAIPRYRLWLRMHDLGWDPENLDLEQALTFCDGPLRIFLAESGLKMSSRSIRRLRREIGRFDPDILTPYERVAEL